MVHEVIKCEKRWFEWVDVCRSLHGKFTTIAKQTASKQASRSRLRSDSTSSQCYELPSCRLKIGERNFSFAGSAAWNSLPAAHTIKRITKFINETWKHLSLVALSNINFISSFVNALLVTWRCKRRTRNANLNSNLNLWCCPTNCSGLELPATGRTDSHSYCRNIRV